MKFWLLASFVFFLFASREATFFPMMFRGKRKSLCKDEADSNNEGVGTIDQQYGTPGSAFALLALPAGKRSKKEESEDEILLKSEPEEKKRGIQLPHVSKEFQDYWDNRKAKKAREMLRSEPEENQAKKNEDVKNEDVKNESAEMEEWKVIEDDDDDVDLMRGPKCEPPKDEEDDELRAAIDDGLRAAIAAVTPTGGEDEEAWANCHCCGDAIDPDELHGYCRLCSIDASLHHARCVSEEGICQACSRASAPSTGAPRCVPPTHDAGIFIAVPRDEADTTATNGCFPREAHFNFVSASASPADAAYFLRWHQYKPDLHVAIFKLTNYQGAFECKALKNGGWHLKTKHVLPEYLERWD